MSTVDARIPIGYAGIMATPPSLPSRSPTGTFRGAAERMPTLPQRTSASASDRTRGNADEFGLEPDAQVNEWYDVVSTWVSRVRFAWTSTARGGPPSVPTGDVRGRKGYLSVEFLSGATVEYNNPQPYSVFDDMINSSSKGYYIHHASSQLIKQPYTLLSPAIRRVTHEIRNLREPKKPVRGAPQGRGRRFIGGQKQPPKLPTFA